MEIPLSEQSAKIIIANQEKVLSNQENGLRHLERLSWMCLLTYAVLLAVILSKWWFYSALLKTAKKTEILTNATNELLVVAGRLLGVIEKKDEKVTMTLKKVEEKLPEPSQMWKPGDPERRKREV